MHHVRRRLPIGHFRRSRLFFQPCTWYSAGNRLVFNVSLDEFACFLVTGHDFGCGILPAHGGGITLRPVRLLDPHQCGGVGFHRQIPHDLTVLGQAVPALRTDPGVALIAFADEATLLQQAQALAHAGLAELGDGDDGVDLRERGGAVVGGAVREIDEHGLGGSVAHMALVRPG